MTDELLPDLSDLEDAPAVEPEPEPASHDDVDEDRPDEDDVEVPA